MTTNETSQQSKGPNLFREVFDPTVSSIIVFVLADLRHLARTTTNVIKGGDRVLALPMSGPDLRQLMQENDSVLHQKLKANEYGMIQFIDKEYRENYLRKDLDVDSTGATIHHVGDDKAWEECVYAIHTNALQKQVCLTFRGSITIQDWLKDVKMVNGELLNPLYNVSDDSNDNDNDDDEHPPQQPEYVGVHVGFRDYLYGSTPFLLPNSLIHFKLNQDSNKVDDDDDKNKNKARKIDIILEQVKVLMEQHPDYTLCITGHSLGGALAQLISLEATVRLATHDRPVTCVTIASPRVGDYNFRGAIQFLEKKRLLRFLAVTNKFDLVPLAPNRFCRCDVFSRNQFCQPGMQLILSLQNFTTRYHSTMANTLGEELYREMKRLVIMLACGVRMSEQHNYRTYMNRLVAQKEELSNVYLNDLYEKQNIMF